MKTSIYFGLGASVFFVSSLVLAGSTTPITREGSTCPAGYYRSGSYCVPSSGGDSGYTSRTAVVRQGPTCPPGYFRSGSYCLDSDSDDER